MGGRASEHSRQKQKHRQRPSGMLKEGLRDWGKDSIGENKVKVRPCRAF